MNKTDFQETETQLLTIDKVFTDGSSTVTFCGRNDAIIKTALETLPYNPCKILILGCGPYELWTTAGQQKVITGNAKVIGVDRSAGISTINKKIKNEGQISTLEVDIQIGNPLFGKEKQPKTSRQLLEEAKISGVEINGLIKVEKSNRDRVEIAPPSDAVEYIAQLPQKSVSIIFSGNLENNLLFQSGITNTKIAAFHSTIHRVLQKQGVYVYSTNEIFFNDVAPESNRSVIGGLENSGLVILFKATQYTHVLERNGNQIITENCGIITAKRGDYVSFPDAKKIIEKTRGKLKTFGSKFKLMESDGPIEKLKAQIANNETNLVVIKIGGSIYHWFNLAGKYENVFPSLAMSGEGFYPELF